MKKILLLLLAFSLSGKAQEQTFQKEEITVTPLLKGSLYSPSKASSKTDLVILIAGSGPTDRDGNQQGLTNNSLRYLAEGLAKNDIATFSFDKRILAQMAQGKMDEKSLSFDDMITDTETVISYFRSQNVSAALSLPDIAKVH